MTTANPELSTAARALQEFDRLIELPESERAAELARLASENRSLAEAVDALLRADAATSGVLDHGVTAMATEWAGENPTTAAAGLKSGDAIGGFVLERVLGRGGMGEVWLAERRDSNAAFVQQVALKVLKRGMDSEALSARFVQERKILAELNHANFARFIDGGISADGRLYFAMEYIDGQNLLDYAQAKSLTVRERVRLLAEVSEAVAYAQNHLVVHRDLKPSNILVDAAGQPRILDFGIAKLLGERAPDASLTHTGMHALSPAYAAPEQVLGETISTATDVYALGTILFELLTGKLPHPRQLRSIEALAAQINSEQTPPPSQILRRLHTTTNDNYSSRALRDVAGDLDIIVLTALKREPARRYASAAALAEDLHRWLEARPIAAQRDTRRYRLKKFVARNRLIVGSASAVFLALIAGLAVALWQATVAREQTKLAQLQLQRAETIKDFTQSLFREQDPFARATAAVRTPSELIAIGIERAQTQFSDDPRTRLEVLEDLASIQALLGEFVPSAELLEKIVAQRRGDDRQDPVALARTQSLLAVALGGLGRLDEGLALAKQASYTLRRQLGSDHPDSIRAEARALRLWLLTGTLEQLNPVAQDLLVRSTKVFGPSAAETLSIMVDLTTIQERFDQLEPMRASLLDLLARIEREKGPNHVLLARPLARLGDLERVLQNNDAATPLFDRAIAIARLHQLKPLLGSMLMRRGDNLRRMGRNEAAKAAFDEAIQLLPANSGEWAQLQQLRGVLARVLGDFDAALAFTRESQLGFERALGNPSIYSWTSELSAIGIELERAEKNGTRLAPELEDRAKAAEVAMRELSPGSSFDVFLALGTKAQVEAALGKNALAKLSFDEAIVVGSSVYSADHPSVIDLRIKRSALLDRQHDADARQELEQILAMPGLSEELRAQAQKALVEHERAD